MSSEFICVVKGSVGGARLAIQNANNSSSKCQNETLPHNLNIEFKVQILGLGLAGTDWDWICVHRLKLVLIKDKERVFGQRPK